MGCFSFGGFISGSPQSPAPQEPELTPEQEKVKRKLDGFTSALYADYNLVKNFAVGELPDHLKLENIRYTYDQYLAGIQDGTITIEDVADLVFGRTDVLVAPEDVIREPNLEDINVQVQPNDTLSVLIKELNEKGAYIAPIQQIMDATKTKFPDQIWIDPNIINIDWTIVFPQSPPDSPEDPVVGFEDMPTISIPDYDPSVSDPNELEPIFSTANPTYVEWNGKRYIIVPQEEWSDREFDVNSPFEGENSDQEGGEGAPYVIYAGDLSEVLITITVHHTGEFGLSTPDLTAIDNAEVEKLLGIIQDNHMDSQGWSDIGYNFVIAPDGTIYEGRDLRVLPTHTDGFNTGNVGVALIGDFTGDGEPTEDQLRALEGLVGMLSSTFDIRCLGYHSQFNATAGPGNQTTTSKFDFMQESHGMGSYQCYRPPK